MTAIICAMALFVGYNVWFMFKYGLPPSLSSTYYTPLGRRLLVPVMTASGVLLAHAFRSPHTLDYLCAILAIGGYLLVACSPQSRDKKEGRTHLIAALISGIGTQLLVATNYPYLLSLWIVLLPLSLWSKHAIVLWAEYICFTSACIVILLNM